MWISFVLHLDGWNLAELCLIGFVGRLTWHGSQMSQVPNLWLIRLHSILHYKHRIRKDTRVPGCSLFSELRQKGIDVLASVISWLMQDPRNASWWKCCWWILILSSRLDTWSSYIECCKLRGLIWAWKIWACCSGHWQRCYRQCAAHNDGCDSKSLSYVQCQVFVCSLFDISSDIYVLCSMALLEETEKDSILLATQHGIIRQSFLPNLRLSLRGQLWGNLAVGREQLQRSSLWLCRQHWNDLKMLSLIMQHVFFVLILHFSGCRVQFPLGRASTLVTLNCLSMICVI